MHQNETIRSRYFELETAWKTAMNDNAALREENARLRDENRAKTLALEQADLRNGALEAKREEVHRAFVQQRNLAEDIKLELSKKSTECDLLTEENSAAHQAERAFLEQQYTASQTPYQQHLNRAWENLEVTPFRPQPAPWGLTQGYPRPWGMSRSHFSASRGQLQ